MIEKHLAPSASFKIDLMFEGLRYSEALGESAQHSFPNYYPYRFAKGEPDPTGKGLAPIPYLLTTEDGTLIRIKGNPASPWTVAGSLESGYQLLHETAPSASAIPVQFEPLPEWMGMETSDGFPMARAGVSLHGDMAVINVAPGCDYFLEKTDQEGSARCTFCSYGAPDERTRHLGQIRGQTALLPVTYQRLAETLQRVIEESRPRHLYLVGGSMTDWREEGKRFVELARAVQEVNRRRIPVACGSGALPQESLLQLHSERLVESVCFNLEIWSEPLFAKICPGKNKFVGYRRWIESLEQAVRLWGPGRVYSAMVAGIEFEPEHNLTWDEAANLAIQGAEDLSSRGIIPIYSLYWPLAGRDHPQYFERLRSYFERLNLAYLQIRQKHGLQIWDGFMCHSCAYMQLECDLDRC